jgi:hypothetical protein
MKLYEKIPALSALALMLCAAEARADVLVDGRCVNSPSHIIQGVSGYALGRIGYEGCPSDCPGGFTPSPTNPHVCVHTASGQQITGWLIIRLECPGLGCGHYTGQAANGLRLTSANHDDGCTTLCGSMTSTKIFYSTDLTYTNWTYVNEKWDPANFTSSSQTFIVGPPAVNITALLITRNSAADQRPNPRWYEIEHFPLYTP